MGTKTFQSDVLIKLLDPKHDAPVVVYEFAGGAIKFYQKPTPPGTRYPWMDPPAQEE